MISNSGSGDRSRAIGSAPRFVAKDADGNTVHERRWGQGESLDHAAALDFLAAFLQQQLRNAELIGVGHRVVHGGMLFADPVRVDAQVLGALESLQSLAPLHQPHNLAPIRRLLQSRPDLPQVACFDTAFHRTNPEVAQMFALPYAMHQQGVRRYGFHGLSYEYVADALARFDEDAARGRTIVLHLGNGCSMCALDGGRSVASTMGFTAVDGLMMGTRTGALDPGVVLYLMTELAMTPAEIERLLYSESGLLGVSGIASDMRTLLASDEPRARLAIDLFRLPDPPRDRRTGGPARRPRRARVHRRDRRELRRDPRPRLPRRRVDRRRAGWRCQRRWRAADQPCRQPRRRLGGTDQRGIDDRAADRAPDQRRRALGSPRARADRGAGLA